MASACFLLFTGALEHSVLLLDFCIKSNKSGHNTVSPILFSAAAISRRMEGSQKGRNFTFSSPRDREERGKREEGIIEGEENRTERGRRIVECL